MILSEKRSIKEKTLNFLNCAKWVFKTTWKISPAIFLGILFLKLISSAVPAAAAWVGRCLINEIVDASKAGTNDFSLVLPWLLYAFSLAIVAETTNVAFKILKRRLSDLITLKIDFDMIEHSAKLDVGQHEDPNFQDIAGRAKQNSASHFTRFFMQIVQLSSDNLKILGLISILYIIDPVIVFVTVPVILPYLIFRWSQSKKKYRQEYLRTKKKRWASYFTSITTNLRSLPEVKILNLAPFLLKQYRDLIINFFRQDRNIYMYGFIGGFFFSLIFLVAFYILFARIVLGVLSGSLTVGDVALFAGATKQMQNLLTSLADQINYTIEETLYLDNLKIFFNIQPKIRNIASRSLVSCKGKVEIQNLSFSYPGTEKKALSSISLNIQPGEIVAIVGKNGSGKTTLAKLIARIYDPDGGSIILDGVDIKDLSLNYYYKQISFIFQDVNRYEATVADNIAYGDLDYLNDRNRMKITAALVDVDKMIDRMPEKYETMLGRKFGEYDLSGGQWRKIAIARAAARRDASILILDEPTAGLDTQAISELLSHFKKLAANRTTILISHHFSTIGLADRIIVLDEGQIVESGTHIDLLNKNGNYAYVYNLHTKKM